MVSEDGTLPGFCCLTSAINYKFSIRSRTVSQFPNCTKGLDREQQLFTDMYVTKLIKDKKYRDFILSRFPKPRGTKTAESLIQSSSIVGNAFEIYFKLVISKITESEIDFDEELSAAQSNINWLEKRESLFTDQKGLRIVYVKQKYLKDIRKLVTATFEKEVYKFIKANGVFRIEVFEKNVLKIFSFKTQTNLKVMNSFYGNNFTIYCKEDVLKEVANAIDRFKKEVKFYTPNSTLSTELLLSILHLANISSQFFIINPVFHCYTKSEVKKLRDSFNKAYNPFALINFKNVFFKPRLNWHQVRARPDFILNNSILEIKTGKEYLTTDDYLQGITYLLFSYQNTTRQEYGKIEKLQIYYPFIARIYTIDATSIKLSRNDKRDYKELVVNFYKNGCC